MNMPADNNNTVDVSLVVREYYSQGGMSINPGTIRKWASRNGYGAINESEIMAVLASMQRFTVNEWEAQTKGGGSMTLHQFKATYSLDIDMRKALKHFIEQDIVPIKIKKRKRKESTGKIAVLSIPDIHVGKFAWEPEVGEAYDTKRAVEIYTKAVENLGGRIAEEKVDRIMYVVGNDLLHTDTTTSTTTKGTPQDTDTRWQYSFRRAKECIVSSAIALLDVANVDIVVQPGNHDRMMAWAMGEVLAAYFRNTSISVDNEPAYRKYKRYGSLLFGITHGDMVKQQALPAIMATEAPEDWGQTTWHEWFLGHFHRKKEFLSVGFEDKMGVALSFLPSLTATDRWHYEMGYVGSKRSAEAHIYSKEGKKIQSLYYFL